jgi:hypothetical protein
LCELRVSIRNAFISDDEQLYLNPYGVDTWAHVLDRKRYRAPEDNGEVQIRLPAALIRENGARAAYLLLERIYLWFGVPTTEVPYTVGEGDARAVDLEVIRRGGKPKE